MTRIRTRLAAFAMALAAGAGVFLTGAPAAEAAISVKFEYQRRDNNEYRIIIRNTAGTSIGVAQWLGNETVGSVKKERLSVFDYKGDGHGVEAHLIAIPKWVATTRGKAAPSSSDVVGNLPEGSKWNLFVCMVKGTYSKCSSTVVAYA